MNPFDGLSVSETQPTSQPNSDSRGVGRPHPCLYIAAATVSLSLFMPWSLIRIPGAEARQFSLFDFIGGKAMVFAFFFFVSCGVIMWLAGVQAGRMLTAIAVAFVGWLAVLVSVSIGVVRGLIPNVQIANIDFGRGLVGIGPGAVICIGGLLLIGMETLPRESSDASGFNEYGVVGFLLSLVLALTHAAVWVSGESPKFDSSVNLSGDSLIGSFLVSGLSWLTAIVAVVVALSSKRTLSRILSVMLITTGLIKFFHALLFLVAKGFVSFLIPNDLGEVVSLRSRWPLWTTILLSLLSVLIGIAGVVSDRVRGGVEDTAVIRFAPTAFVALVTVSIFSVYALNSRSEDSSVSNASTTTIDETSATNSGNVTTSSIAGDLEVSSTQEILKSVVLVTLRKADGEICATGSGVVVDDGSHIITNHHVVVPTGDISLLCNRVDVGLTEDPSSQPTTFLATEVENFDEQVDLAILRLVDGAVTTAPPMKTRREVLPLDTKIRVIGYPGVGGDTITLSNGVVSGIDKRYGTPFYKVSAVVSPGNSGGPMVDDSGRLVGIVTAFSPAYVECDTTEDCYAAGANLGLVRPISYALDLLNR